MLNKNDGRYIILNNTLSTTDDVQKLVLNLSKKISDDNRIVVISFNFLWKPILNLASFIGIRRKDIVEPNWLTKNDVRNIFYLEGLEEIKSGNRFLFPIDIGPVSDFINRFVAPLPIINNLCLTSFQIFRKISTPEKPSVSIIIPARNESGNMTGIFKKIPKLSKKMEVIFVEGGSHDNTYKTIEYEIKNNKPKWLSAMLYKQTTTGKNNAVEIGFKKAKNDLFMILDADLTVDPQELKKFYLAASKNKAELIMGSRLVYPMESQAMRLLNYFANKVFSWAFSFIICQEVKDTLCGTKVISRKNYQMIKKGQRYFGNFDPFGDFDLIFGAANLDLRIIEIPIRYKDRTYGSTNISRFQHGLLLFKMVFVGALKLKFV